MNFRNWQQYLKGNKLRLPNNSKLAVIFGLSAFCAGQKYFKHASFDVQRAEAEAKQPNMLPLAQTNQHDQLSHQKSHFTYGVSMLPHIEKRQRGGEDAYFADDQFMVVLDGVGGWNDQGVDPGLFSRQLVSLISLERHHNDQQTLKNILVEAVKKTTFKGSSTACLARINQNLGGAVLETTNLGDSGYALFRIKDERKETQDGIEPNPKIVLQFRSKEQQYSFNFPYQCGTNCDLPYNADDNSHILEENDILIMGSDGLFDNVYDEDLLNCIYPNFNKETKQITDHLAAAVCLSTKAEILGKDKKYFSPFAKHAKEQRKYFMGGKLDDVTVIVAQFHKSSHIQ
ncbi:serine threonine family 2c [Stylonychia lemnae]|uniref:Protein phosphatase n=1 Tax=Stylonychia lemnae TaxID=5949 RepID=A0A078A046_STYLE|nr:serine threonine family 2c [Stylonychia lemnae]|eukprot:CDW74148.1 serine threonine family 2c [Stylonychia lemnae]